jgi:hypothetical protein
MFADSEATARKLTEIAKLCRTGAGWLIGKSSTGGDQSYVSL